MAVVGTGLQWHLPGPSLDGPVSRRLLPRLSAVTGIGIVPASYERGSQQASAVDQCSPRAHQSPARPGPGPWALGPAQTQPVQINIMVARARPGPYNISPSDYHS